MSFNKKRPVEYTFKPFVYEKVEPLGDVVPLPRSGHRLVADDCNMYAFGGYNPLVDESEENINTYPLFQELWRFNFASRRWSKICKQESLPHELASNAVVRHGRLLMVYVCVSSSKNVLWARNLRLEFSERMNYNHKIFEVTFVSVIVVLSWQ